MRAFCVWFLHVVPFTPGDSDVGAAAMPCMEIVDSDDESDDVIGVIG